MKRRHAFAIVSTSALAAGVAQAKVTYTNVSAAYPCPSSGPVPARFDGWDMNNDNLEDFYLAFDGYSAPNSQKPYIQGYPTGFTPPNSAILARYNAAAANYGVPLTPFGTMIDGTYLTPAGKAYLYQDNNGKYVGDWNSGLRTESYVGLELFDAGTSRTNFGWARIIYDGLAAPRTLTLVDWAYEDTPGVGIIAGATNTVGAPIIYSEPVSQTVPFGANVQLKVVALAAPAPAYQWKAGPIGSGTYTNLQNGGVLSGATADTLVINGVSAANMLDYIVVITNSLGATTSSPAATLTVSAPVVTPTPQVLFGGLTARFDVSVAAGVSPNYQWRKNGANLSDDGRIVGSKAAHLRVGSLQAADAGTYDVVLTVNAGSVTSTGAALTVLPTSGESAYEAALLSVGPVAYYRFAETGNPASSNLMAYDNAGAFNGVYGVDVNNGFNGVAGPRPADGFTGFAANHAAVAFLPNDPNARIALAPWNLNTNVATFTAWVKPAVDQVSQAGVLVTGTTSGTQAGICYSVLNSSTGFYDIGYNWNDLNECGLLWDTQLTPPFNQWSFVAMAISKTNTTAYMFNANGLATAFLDGTVSNIFAVNGFTNQVMAFNNPEYVGTDPQDGTGGRNFNGAISDVAVFNRTLSQAELQTIYNGALGILPPVTLQITRVGSNVLLSWPMGRLLEATSPNGPWTLNSTATSPYTVNPTGGAKFYRVQVQ